MIPITHIIIRARKTPMWVKNVLQLVTIIKYKTQQNVIKHFKIKIQMEKKVNSKTLLNTNK